ncbi:hypothetical protein [Nocardia sp. NPDC050710]
MSSATDAAAVRAVESGDLFGEFRPRAGHFPDRADAAGVRARRRAKKHG